MSANRIKSSDVSPRVGDEPSHWFLRATHRRHVEKLSSGDIGAAHPVSEGFTGTKFKKTLRYPEEEKTVTKDGKFSSKLGASIRKTAWKGRAMRSLTLEERATCPRACENWTICYGNGMRFTRRMIHGEELEELLFIEMSEIGAGSCVRLHQLGDFYSERYVDIWRRIIERFDVVAFGYTAHPASSPIGQMLATMAASLWDRFAIRFSGRYQPDTVRRALTVRSTEEAAAAGAIVCPAQIGKTANCGTCGLCWTSSRPIAFLEH